MNNQKTVFILSQFPSYDETFILRELYLLSKTMDYKIFSLKQCRDEIMHGEAEELMPLVMYVPFFFSWRIISAQFVVFWRYPRRYLVALLRHIFGNLRSFQFLIRGLAFFPKAVYLAKWIKDNAVTHMHAYWATYPATVALIASEITKVPFSFTGHAHDIYVDATHLKEKMAHAVFVSTCTNGNKEYLRRINPDYPPERISVIHHGLDLTKFRTEDKKRNKVFQVLSVGTLRPYKGFNFLIQAAKILKDRGLDFHVTIVGGGNLEDDLRKHIRMLGLEDIVKMTGALRQADVIPCYKSCDVLVLMAQPEAHFGIPNVFVEALAARTAVITTRFGSVEELVRHGETGLLVPPTDSMALADAIETLYRNDDYRLQLIEAGHRLVVERFDVTRNVAKFKNELDRME